MRKYDFSDATRKLLADRVGHRCSNPGCRRPTVGPHSDENKKMSCGEAAHIRAASPGGKRYDPDMSDQERVSASNGLWLCSTCHTLVDSDASLYTVEELQHWKIIAEQRALEELDPGVVYMKDRTVDEDRELIGFFIDCMVRPAFEDSLRKQERLHDQFLVDFERAVRDTMVALNTGVLTDRNGRIIKTMKGRSAVHHEKWGDTLDEMANLLKQILRTLQQRDTSDPKCLWYDRGLEQWLEQRRGQLMELTNFLCREVGRRELKYYR